MGLTKSLNILIKKSNVALIARQDADDYSHKERIEKQVKKLTNYNLDFVSCRAEVINSSKVIPSVSYYLPKKIIKYKIHSFMEPFLSRKNNLLKLEVTMKIFNTHRTINL